MLEKNNNVNRRTINLMDVIIVLFDTQLSLVVDLFVFIC